MHHNFKLTQPEPKDWYNYTVKRPKLGGYHLCHRDTGVVLAEGPSHELEAFHTWKLLTSVIKTKADVYRFFAFVAHLEKERWAGSDGYNPRTNSARSEIESDKNQNRLSLKEMIAEIASKKNTCCGTFRLCSYLLDEELERKLGRDGLKNLKKFEPIGYPFVRREVPQELAKRAIASWESIHSIKPNQVTYDEKARGYRAPHEPHCVFRVSFYRNGGNWTKIDEQGIYIFEDHSIPPPYLKKGDAYRGDRGTFIVSGFLGKEFVRGVSVKDLTTETHSMWNSHHYGYAGSNNGLSGYSKRLSLAK